MHRQIRHVNPAWRGRGRAVIAALCVLGAAPVHAQPTVGDPGLAIELVASGLDAPTTMAFVGPGDILVLQKNDGRVRRVLNGVLQPDPVLDVAVNTDSERGLLGIAVNTEQPRRVFLYYTEVSDADGDGLPDSGTPLGNRVYRYAWNAATSRLENRQLVLDLPVTSGPNHDGGILLLGPTPTPGPQTRVGDGSPLYVVIGDVNRDGQLQNVPGGAAADDSGVILRVQQDGTPVSGNPFAPYCSATTTQACASGSGCPAGQSCISRVARYLAYGVRNSFGLALDPVTGILWDTENGPGSYDEINLVAAGFNSGWVPIMGPDSRDSNAVGDLFAMPGGASAYSDPEFSWLNPVAVTSIVFPHDSALGPAYDGVALVGDFNLGNLSRFPLNPERTGFALSGLTGLADLVADNAAERERVRLGANFGGISDLEIGPDGALYVVSIGAGAIHRVVNAYDVAGALRYYVDARPVSNATVRLRGATSTSMTTDVNGAFAFAAVRPGVWTLAAEKNADLRNGLSALDGAGVLEFIAGMSRFNDFQRLACDVTGDGTCSPLDGARILQFVAGQLSRFPAALLCQSDWLFVPGPAAAQNQIVTAPRLDGSCTPGQIRFQPLTSDAVDQDFIAILLGDVTGNWDAR
jgi:glucose/arabinose dehydrogenase